MPEQGAEIILRFGSACDLAALPGNCLIARDHRFACSPFKLPDYRTDADAGAGNEDPIGIGTVSCEGGFKECLGRGEEHFVGISLSERPRVHDLHSGLVDGPGHEPVDLGHIGCDHGDPGKTQGPESLEYRTDGGDDGDARTAPVDKLGDLVLPKDDGP
ncbi:hypothetical protein D9M70_493780 [compost metagenome]